VAGGVGREIEELAGSVVLVEVAIRKSDCIGLERRLEAVDEVAVVVVFGEVRTEGWAASRGSNPVEAVGVVGSCCDDAELVHVLLRADSELVPGLDAAYTVACTEQAVKEAVSVGTSAATAVARLGFATNRLTCWVKQ